MSIKPAQAQYDNGKYTIKKTYDNEINIINAGNASASYNRLTTFEGMLQYTRRYCFCLATLKRIWFCGRAIQCDI